MRKILKIYEKLFPDKPIKNWSIFAHGNSRALAFKSDGSMNDPNFSVADQGLMKRIAEKLDPSATIGLCGCGNGSKEENIAKAFSTISRSRIVFAASRIVRVSLATIVHDDKRNTIMFLNFPDDQGNRTCRAYRNGELILDGMSQSHPRPGL